MMTAFNAVVAANGLIVGLLAAWWAGRFMGGSRGVADISVPAATDPRLVP